MPISRLIAGTLVAGAVALVTGGACAQGYPNKTIRLVTLTAGSGIDFVARLIAPGMSSGLGQSVIVDNRAAVIAIDVVVKSPPDGYNLLVTGSTVWLLPFLHSGVSYDPVKDLAPVTLTNTAPNVLFVHPSLPAKDVRGLIALARARPGQLNYAAAAAGSPSQIAGELFKSMARVNIVGVPYKGSGPSLNAVIGGEVEMGIANAATVMPHVKSGRLKGLAVTTLQPSTLVPGLPTVAASGLPGYESISIYGIFAPAKTPAAVIDRLNQEIVRVLNRLELKEKFVNSGLEIVGSTPQQYAAKRDADMALTGKLIRDAGIRAE